MRRGHALLNLMASTETASHFHFCVELTSVVTTTMLAL